MSALPGLRASDRDRDAVAQELRDHFADSDSRAPGYRTWVERRPRH